MNTRLYPAAWKPSNQEDHIIKPVLPGRQTSRTRLRGILIVIARQTVAFKCKWESDQTRSRSGGRNISV